MRRQSLSESIVLELQGLDLIGWGNIDSEQGYIIWYGSQIEIKSLSLTLNPLTGLLDELLMTVYGVKTTRMNIITM